MCTFAVEWRGSIFKCTELEPASSMWWDLGVPNFEFSGMQVYINNMDACGQVGLKECSVHSTVQRFMGTLDS